MSAKCGKASPLKASSHAQSATRQESSTPLPAICLAIRMRHRHNNGSFGQEVGPNPGKLRIGFMNRAPQGNAPLHADCTAAVEATAHTLAALGHTVEEAHPAALDEVEFLRHFASVVTAHASVALEEIGRLLGRH